MATGKKAWIRVLLLAVCCCAACTKELDLPDINGQGKIVLLGELITGDTAILRAGESVPLVSGSSMQFRLPKDMTVSLTPVHIGTGQPMAVREDSWSGLLKTLAVSRNEIMQPHFSYRIKAQDPRLGTAECEVTMPPAFTAQVLDTTPVHIAGTNALRVRVRIQDDGSRENYYVIESVKQAMAVEAYFFYQGDRLAVSDFRALYDSLKAAGVNPPLTYDTTYFNDNTRMVVYSNDPNTENAKLGSTFSPNKRILLSDKMLNGTLYTTDVFIDKSQFRANTSGMKGRVLLWIKSVPASYFQFLRAYESFESVTGWGSLAQPRKMDGNVNGGLGMVGSAARIQYVYLYDSWDF